MRPRHLILSFWLALSLSAPAPALAAGGGEGKKAVKTAKSHGKKGKKGRGKRHPVFQGYLVPASKLRTEPLPRPSGKLTVYSVNTRESLSVDLYNADGSMNEESLVSLNHLWRCHRTGTEKPINSHLFEILSLIEDHYPGKTLELVSGFRNQSHTSSFHFQGSASDIRLPGVSDQQLRDFVATLDTGNMGLGIYPRSGFIHVDVRPEASYRWTDWSPPGSNEPKRHKKAKKPPHNT